jgi:hypothetical protein
VAVAPGWWFDGEGGEVGWVAVSCGHLRTISEFKLDNSPKAIFTRNFGYPPIKRDRIFMSLCF